MIENWGLNEHLRDEHILINIFLVAQARSVYIFWYFENVNNRGLLLAWFPETLPGGR
jgi:hypothetical protein